MAEVFVFPSWFEGLGLPPLEAMLCGTPVIASDRGSIPEVTGGAALLIDAEDEHALAKHLIRVLTDQSEAQRLRQMGFMRSKMFSWTQIGGRMLEIYAQTAALPSPSIHSSLLHLVPKREGDTCLESE
jgi:glycosyltransferase involved in cell wall biosynthesis